MSHKPKPIRAKPMKSKPRPAPKPVALTSPRATARRVLAVPVTEPVAPPEGVSFTYEEVTPAIATRWLEGKCSNRNISDPHVERLARDMRGGRWSRNGETIKFTADGRLVDGQHRLWAVILAGVPVHFDVARGVTEEAMLTVDTNRVRTFGNYLEITSPQTSDSMIVAAVTRFLHWYETHVATEGLADGARSFQRHRPTHSDLAALLARWPEAVEAAKGARRAPKGTIPASILAFVYAGALREDQRLAREFIEAVATGSGLPEGSAVLRLRERMMAATVTKRSSDRLYWAAIVAKAWRAFVEGRRVHTLKLGEQEPFPRFHWRTDDQHYQRPA